MADCQLWGYHKLRRDTGKKEKLKNDLIHKIRKS